MAQQPPSVVWALTTMLLVGPLTLPLPPPATWVMEFDVGGYFLHDASWEPSSMFGPGSENSYVASHGCVHIPTPVMRWAYQWTPIGTPVIITQ